MLKSSLIIFALAASAAALANAASITYFTPLGSVDTSSQPVDASALITTNANGTVTVILSDLQTSWQDAGQLLTDFSFTLSTTPTGLPSTSTPTGSLITISGAGSSIADVADAIAGWKVASSGSTVSLTWPAGAQGQEIIGPGAAGPFPYSSANGSIDGNGPHNPFLDGTATFNFAAGVTADTVVTGASFSFGTTAGDDVTGTTCTVNCGGGVTGGQTPEPTTMLMAFSGLGMVGFRALCKRKKA